MRLARRRGADVLGAGERRLGAARRRRARGGARARRAADRAGWRARCPSSTRATRRSWCGGISRRGAPAVVVMRGTGRRSASCGGRRRPADDLDAGALRALAGRGQPGAPRHRRPAGGRARGARLRGGRARARRLARAPGPSARPRRRRRGRRAAWWRARSPRPRRARWSSTTASSRRRSRCPAAGRVDVVTARSERYEAPGALPRVMPAAIGQDLRRRDFTVNAMAVELASGDVRTPRSARRTRRRRRAAGCASCIRCRSSRTPRASSAPRATRRAWASRWTRGARGAGRWRSSWRRMPRCRRRGSPPSWSASSRTRAPAPALVALARAGAFRLLATRLSRDAAVRGRDSPRCRPPCVGARARPGDATRWSCSPPCWRPTSRTAWRRRCCAGSALSGAPLGRVREALARDAAAERAARRRGPAERGGASAARRRGPLAPAWLHLAGDDATAARLERSTGAEPDARPVLGGDDGARPRRGARSRRRGGAGRAARRAAGRGNPRSAGRNGLR